MTLEYTFDIDYTVWMPVPLEFPWIGYDTAMSWAADVTEDLLAGRGAPEEVRRAFAATALERALMPAPLEEPIERFWRRPDTGAPDRLVHLYALQVQGDPDPDELTELARTGLGGFVQSVTPLDRTPFTTALRVVLLLELPGGSTATVMRLIGARDGTVLMLELVDDNVAAVAFLEPEIEALFRSIRLRSA
ncbi:hypothetical protein [Microbacterium allomyrinae]|uniref:Uncharacterized protein n=1 Tax=Microbacterium allomyrinae TaxID=2830666 RepID=A0A9X1LTI7_9MICO|nr:hypothetical protein [Microbacterium allomyrinae]MCC2031689.1 hypothetical protein [Microbacterium allomyrinae]